MDDAQSAIFASLPSSSTESNKYFISHYDSDAVAEAKRRQKMSLHGSRRLAAAHYGIPPGHMVHRSFNRSRYETSQRSARGSEKATGLRHFSTKVCEKVKQKGLTNYNEVADELVSEYFDDNIVQHGEKQEYEMKNIRRRVYDALNVLLAMNIITKNKKDIRWIGLPASSAQEISKLTEEKEKRVHTIKSKLETIQEMVIQLITYRNLVKQNREYEQAHGKPSPDNLLYLPFFLITTDKKTKVDCSVSSDKSEYLFSFNNSFQIHDDLVILKKLNLACGLDSGNSSAEDADLAKSYLPVLLQPYVNDILSGHQRLAQKEASKDVEEIDEEEPILEEESGTLDHQYTRAKQTIASPRPLPGKTIIQQQSAGIRHVTLQGSPLNRSPKVVLKRPAVQKVPYNPQQPVKYYVASQLPTSPSRYVQQKIAIRPVSQRPSGDSPRPYPENGQVVYRKIVKRIVQRPPSSSTSSEPQKPADDANVY